MTVPPTPALHLELAPGVHGVEHADTNCYLITDDHGVTLVDAGFRTTGRAVLAALAALGRSPDQIRGLVLTHGHFDHVGYARGLQAALGTEVWVHRDDVALAAHPYRYRPEQNRLLYPGRHRRSWPVLGRMVLAGALTVRGVRADRALRHEQVLDDLPGSPQIVHVPGHTAGQCALWLPDRRVLLSGDALVTLDPYTGRRGARVVAPAATADTAQALDSLDRLAVLPAELVLPGHGAPWAGSAGAAVAAARRHHAQDRRGPS